MSQVIDDKEIMAEIKEQVRPVPGLSIDTLQVRLRSIKEIKKRITDRKEQITKPMREALDSTRALFKPLEIAVEEADKTVRSLLLVAEEKREAEQKKLDKDVERGKISVDQAMTVMTPDSGGLFRMVKKLVIKKKNLIPDKFWIIDEVAVRAALMAGKKVPGAELKEEKTVVSR